MTETHGYLSLRVDLKNIFADCIAGDILSVESNQNVESKPKNVESKYKKCGVLISAYNRLKSHLRASLNRETIVDYLYINVNMPPLSEFDPRPAVLKWLNDKDRRNCQTPKASKQKWFQSVFDNNSDDDSEKDLDESKLVRKF